LTISKTPKITEKSQAHVSTIIEEIKRHPVDLAANKTGGTIGTARRISQKKEPGKTGF